MIRTDSFLRALALALFLPMSGCAYLTVRPPAAPTESSPVKCTRHPPAAYLDAVAGAVLTAGTLWLAASAGLQCGMGFALGVDEGCSPLLMAPALGSALLANVSFSSAGYGFEQGAACRAAMDGPPPCDPATGMGCGPLGLPAGTARPEAEGTAR
jgi:hypothetical protein